MGTPAAVVGDRLTGTCSIHLIPNPATGAPQPGPPLPFSAPLTTGVCTTVFATGKPVAVVGAGGVSVPPHVGLHPADPFLAPPAQQGIVTMGSSSVLAGGVPVARTGDSGTCCGLPVGTLAGSAASVLVGG